MGTINTLYFQIESGIDRAQIHPYPPGASTWLDKDSADCFIDGEWVYFAADGSGVLARPEDTNHLLVPSYPIFAYPGSITSKAIQKISVVIGGMILCRTKWYKSGETYTPGAALHVAAHSAEDLRGELVPAGEGEGYVVGRVAEKGEVDGWLYFIPQW